MKKYLSIIFSVVLFPLFANPYLLGNRNNPASVKVVPDGENLQVSCTFKAQEESTVQLSVLHTRINTRHLKKLINL